MKMRILWIKLNNSISKLFLPIKRWIAVYRYYNPYRFLGLVFLLVFTVTTLLLRVYVTGPLIRKFSNNDDQVIDYEAKSEAYENVATSMLVNNDSSKFMGAQTSRFYQEVRSDVGFVDLRVLTLEDFFNAYGSPLAEYADEFIEATERYNVNNWQLLPAIAINETNGCQTGISYEQRNCWGWGGAGENRWEFYSFEHAIDTIMYNMIRGYGNDRMNARDIQDTYCGIWCREYNGWKWAKGVNQYVYRINDFGEKYGLERTHEIVNFDEE